MSLNERPVYVADLPSWPEDQAEVEVAVEVSAPGA
jgi:hypothetical protein